MKEEEESDIELHPDVPRHIVALEKLLGKKGGILDLELGLGAEMPRSLSREERPLRKKDYTRPPEAYPELENIIIQKNQDECDYSGDEDFVREVTRIEPSAAYLQCLLVSTEY